MPGESRLKNIALLDFFEQTNYNYKKDLDKLKTICYYTKTRAGIPVELEDFSMSYGMEQPFLIKAIAESLNCENFFEIGTGRGTACYSAALSKNMKQITTIDIIPFKHKRNEFIGCKPKMVSNRDLYMMIPYREKEKINFFERRDLPGIIKDGEKKFDMCFIDGNHDSPSIIFEDFLLSKRLLKDDGAIVFDDYFPNKFVVKKIVDRILEADKSLVPTFINFRGHLFPNRISETESGAVLLKRA